MIMQSNLSQMGNNQFSVPEPFTIPSHSKEHSSNFTQSEPHTRSVFWRKWNLSHIDPLAVVEVSLTSVKYAFYQALGYVVLCTLGYNNPAMTVRSAAIYGFAGGAIFTVPYLILLLPVDGHVSRELGTCSEQFLLLCTEMMYSAVAGGVGIIALDGWSSYGVFLGVIRGLGGPFISIVFLFLSLKVILGTVSLSWRLKGLLDVIKNSH